MSSSSMSQGVAGRGWLLKAAGAVLLVGALGAKAGAAGDPGVRATIPFSFVVNSMTLPPGPYTVSMESLLGNVLMVRDQRHGAFAESSNVEDAKGTHPRLVFHRYGDQYILREVWMSATEGKELPETRRERELQAASLGAGGDGASFERVVLLTR